MALSNNQQAIVVFIASFFTALGVLVAAIPTETIPNPYKLIIAGILLLAGPIGFALKEAAGGTPAPTPAAPTATTKQSINRCMHISILRKRLMFLSYRK
jgi:hypothetical protein